MGIRGELYSTKVALENRTYFFNVKENRVGDLYLNIVESKNKETGGFERQSIVLFAEDLQDFLKGFDDSLRVMEKAAKEKRKVERPDHGHGREGYRGDRHENHGADRGHPEGRHEKHSEGRHENHTEGRSSSKRFIKSEKEAPFGRKKVVTAKKTAGTHGIKGALRKTKVVRAIKNRDIPED